MVGDKGQTMKKLQARWNANTQNKIIILVILFLILFCALAICILAGIFGFILFGDSSSAPLTRIMLS